MTDTPQLNLRGTTVRVGTLAGALLVARVARVRSPTLRVITADEIIEHIDENARCRTVDFSITVPRSKNNPDAGGYNASFRIRHENDYRDPAVLCAIFFPAPGIGISEIPGETTLWLDGKTFPASLLSTMRNHCIQQTMTFGRIVETGLPEIDALRPWPVPLAKMAASAASTLILKAKTKDTDFDAFAIRLAQACR